jgi:plastocyanin
MRTLFIVLAIVLVAVVGYVLFGNRPMAPESSENQGTQSPGYQQPATSTGSGTSSGSAGTGQNTSGNRTVTVAFTGSGFSPATATINKGDTVIFKNESNTQVWPASNNHPTHLLYPTRGGCVGSTFDACRGIPPGESWSFKFDYAGTWGYHDHMNPNNKGTIVVK